MSQHFILVDLYHDIMMSEIYPPIFEACVGSSSEELEFDPSMVMPMYSPKMDPFEPTSLYMVPFDSIAIPSTIGNHVSGRGHGHEDVFVGWGNGFISS